MMNIRWIIMGVMNDAVLGYWSLLAVPVVAMVGFCAVLGERARGKRRLEESVRDAVMRGKAEMAFFIENKGLEKLKSAANGVTIRCELVGGPCDGVVVTVAKDAEWTWATESRADGSSVVHLYRFANRSNKRGLWVFDYAAAGVKVGEKR